MTLLLTAVPYPAHSRNSVTIYWMLNKWKSPAQWWCVRPLSSKHTNEPTPVIVRIWGIESDGDFPRGLCLFPFHLPPSPAFCHSTSGGEHSFLFLLSLAVMSPTPIDMPWKILNQDWTILGIKWANLAAWQITWPHLTWASLSLLFIYFDFFSEKQYSQFLKIR